MFADADSRFYIVVLLTQITKIPYTTEFAIPYECVIAFLSLLVQHNEIWNDVK